MLPLEGSEKYRVKRINVVSEIPIILEFLMWAGITEACSFCDY